jgi:hypothetical protein
MGILQIPTGIFMFLQVGQKHKDACEIIIGYLVKRCDLFNENAKQS